MNLTPRQASIVRLLEVGQSDKQIAATLGISVWTVRTHLRRLAESHKTHGRMALVNRLRGVANFSDTTEFQKPATVTP